MYPPGEVPPGLKKDDEEDEDWDAPKPLKYLLEVYPKARSRPIECTQRAGEVIFVPSNYWHMVFNVTDTIAVTQNFCNESNIQAVWPDVKKDKDMAPEFVSKALKLKPNVLDGLVTEEEKLSYQSEWEKVKIARKEKREKKEKRRKESKSSSSKKKLKK